MLTVGLTGGIGSGKSTVARMFSDLGIPVYIADIKAKIIMQEDEEVKKAIQNLIGEDAYLPDGKLNRTFIADKVFKNKESLQSLNHIVHPAVAKDFNKWKENQNTPYVIKEAAILFENGGYKACDQVILVIAPSKLRLERVVKRDQISEESIKERMQHQWEDVRKIPLADYVLNNEDLEKTLQQVRKIHNKLTTF
ncbi:dephospho-CoA kinase [Aquimarina sp. ERC-38]|uniref:dephospho-CoA kinase n=1 Tax=Aquimarina sp. ERC-38 TaxID=2949996 RepID=UPI002246DC27|nr:dephospho-CoA kinase [Aquimarina sp. ERC-38]UZO79374.1 dephospho-CoA kinase [Aquimarina sp. ERC-38]